MQTALDMRTMPSRSSALILSDLPPGESAYVSPAALLLTPNRSCRIRTDAPVRRTPDAGTTMHVTRTDGGYVVDITYCTHQWATSEQADCSPYAPVVRVIFGDEFLR